MSDFTIRIPDHVLKDLATRLAATRLPAEMPREGWDYGTDLTLLAELVAYWRDGFDWREQEARLNRLNHVLIDVDGLPIHAVHERGDGPDPLPLVLTHGWPSSFVEYERVLPLLTHPDDPADAFDVVVPSLPGFGFSGTPKDPGGMVFGNVAGIWAKLMTALGYERFGASGGDLGSYTTSRLGMHHRDRLVGVHMDPIGSIETPLVDPADGTPEEQAYFAHLQQWGRDEAAYSVFQATKPRTIAVGLNDSPAGLAAYIVEKFRTWSDCGGDVLSRFTMDQLLTTITIYWATGTIGSSFLSYYDHRHHRAPMVPVEVPTAIAIWPGDPIVGVHPAPRSYVERGYDVHRYTLMPKGGHFYPSEEPELLAQDLREFFRPLRSR